MRDLVSMLLDPRAAAASCAGLIAEVRGAAAVAVAVTVAVAVAGAGQQ